MFVPIVPVPGSSIRFTFIVYKMAFCHFVKFLFVMVSVYKTSTKLFRSLTVMTFAKYLGKSSGLPCVFLMNGLLVY